MTGRSANSGMRSISAVSVRPGQHQVKRDQVRPPGVDGARDIARIVRGPRRVVGVRERVTHELRVVVDYQEARLPRLFLGEAGGDETRARAGLVDGGDAVVTGGGQFPGAVHHFVQHGLQIQARADV